MDYKKATSIFDFTVKDTYMADVPLGEYCKGYVTLVVNIASTCVLTDINYAQLTQLDKEYGDSMYTGLTSKSNSLFFRTMMIETVSFLQNYEFSRFQRTNFTAACRRVTEMKFCAI